jgi:hypothetical protein
MIWFLYSLVCLVYVVSEIVKNRRCGLHSGQSMELIMDLIRQHAFVKLLFY